jgi:glycosyltransferase involved in cell wall biosynthesis
MRIGVVTTSYPRWPGDSAGSFVEGHAHALAELGHEVDIVAAGGDAAEVEAGWRAFHERIEPTLVELREFQRREDERRARATQEHEVDLRERERRDADRRAPPKIVVTRNTITLTTHVPGRGLFYGGGAPDALERSPVRSMLAAATFMPRFAATVVKRARNWDHIVAHWLVPSALVAALTRKPLTAIAHGGDIYTLQRMGLLKPTLRALRNAKLVFVSEQLRAIANVPGIVQPMGVDLAHFRSLGRAPTSPPTILVAARLVPIKGIDTAIDAMAHLPHARLVIAGDGPERAALEARARTRVTFLGQVDTHRRDQLLRAASVVVVPSRTINGRSEGCPTIAIEALAAGVPVVATVGRATELVAPNDPIVLAQAIERALASRQSTDAQVADLDWIAVATRLLRNE